MLCGSCIQHKKNSLKFKLLSFWRKYTPFIDQKCNYEKVSKKLGRAPPPSFGQNPNGQQFFLGNRPLDVIRNSITSRKGEGKIKIGVQVGILLYQIDRSECLKCQNKIYQVQFQFNQTSLSHNYSLKILKVFCVTKNYLFALCFVWCIFADLNRSIAM